MVSINSPILSAILRHAEHIHANHGRILAEQYAKADYFYILLKGRVSFSLYLDDEGQELIVGFSDESFTPIGWSGFNPPNRYATTVKVASSRTQLYRWKHEELQQYLSDDDAACQAFLRLVGAKARNLIREAIYLLSAYSPALPVPSNRSGKTQFQSVGNAQEEDLLLFLRRSPFFEIFDEEPLQELSQCMERRQYGANDLVYKQQSEPDGIHILAIGKVRFSYHDETTHVISFRQINTPGFIVGWSGILDLPNLINAQAVQESMIYFIPKSCIVAVSKENQHFATVLYFRLLWLISHQLQAVRARLISAKFNHETVAISNLIEQNSTKLELTSSLHKVPHLLENKLTITDAVTTLHSLESNGTTLERNISELALDILQEIDQERQFYDGLVNVYNIVVKSPKSCSPELVRKKCAEAYQKLFDTVPFMIEGIENLPQDSGHIFIYNHLRNHPFNTLPNQFQLTLDSHFISAQILNAKYQDPGIRIVRIGRGAEYAHQEYYQRLGHIDVYTPESGSGRESKGNLESQRQAFYESASQFISAGLNMIISPEGTSYSTEESPGPFKSGAFRLALSLEREPLIVPIALANFDRRLRHNQFAAVIKRPFKVSEYITDKNSKSEMTGFLMAYQKKFESYVDDAIALAERKT